MKKVPEDIAEIEARIAEFKRANDSKVIPRRKTTKNVARAFRIGTEFVASVFLGICMGFFLDKFFNTRVVFILVFSLFGCIAGMLNVYRSAKEIDKEIEKEEDR